MNVMQSPLANSALALRTSAEPLSMAKTVRAALAQIDRETPVTGVRVMDQIVVDSMAQPRTQAWLMGVFASIALTLAAVGNYGVMSYSVAQSVHDLCIRRALGASAWDVLRLVLRKAILLTGAGLLIGLAGALALTRVLSSLLFHVNRPMDLCRRLAAAGIGSACGRIHPGKARDPSRSCGRIAV